jgi:hypothetical protein
MCRKKKKGTVVVLDKIPDSDPACGPLLPGIGIDQRKTSEKRYRNVWYTAIRRSGPSDPYLDDLKATNNFITNNSVVLLRRPM